MTCDNCEKEDGSRVAYFRWGIANVGFIGCPKHVEEIFEVLREYQRKEYKKECAKR